MSLGVILSGGLPKLTLEAATLAGAEAGAESAPPQGLLSPTETHGSNNELAGCEGVGAALTGAGAGLGTGWDDKLKAELKSLLGIVVGEDTFGAAMGAVDLVVVGDVVEAQPPKSSLLKSSAGMFVTGLGIGADTGT